MKLSPEQVFPAAVIHKVFIKGLVASAKAVKAYHELLLDTKIGNMMLGAI
jgi:beta-glucosidase/6-phospho-beta-glucosidase/beta-galactosidase